MKPTRGKANQQLAEPQNTIQWFKKKPAKALIEH
jgi:hypothetical protein